MEWRCDVGQRKEILLSDSLRLLRTFVNHPTSARATLLVRAIDRDRALNCHGRNMCHECMHTRVSEKNGTTLCMLVEFDYKCQFSKASLAVLLELAMKITAALREHGVEV